MTTREGYQVELRQVERDMDGLAPHTSTYKRLKLRAEALRGLLDTIPKFNATLKELYDSVDVPADDPVRRHTL